MNQIQRRHPDFSRRQLLKYSGLGVAAVAGSSFSQRAEAMTAAAEAGGAAGRRAPAGS